MFDNRWSRYQWHKSQAGLMLTRSSIQLDRECSCSQTGHHLLSSSRHYMAQLILGKYLGFGNNQQEFMLNSTKSDHCPKSQVGIDRASSRLSKDRNERHMLLQLRSISTIPDKIQVERQLRPHHCKSSRLDKVGKPSSCRQRPCSHRTHIPMVPSQSDMHYQLDM